MAMHCRPGIVSQWLADAPTSWKYCCAVLSISLLPLARVNAAQARAGAGWHGKQGGARLLSSICPMQALTTPLRIYSSGDDGSMSFMRLWASLNSSFRR